MTHVILLTRQGHRSVEHFDTFAEAARFADWLGRHGKGTHAVAIREDQAR